MEKLIVRFFQSKVVLFTIQILILSLFIYIFDYNFSINFDKSISKERREIIQFIANYVIFDFGGNKSYFICFSWMIISLLPIFAYRDYKRAYSMNLTSYFFPNFFFYVFLSRYSPNYYESNFNDLFPRS